VTARARPAIGSELVIREARTADSTAVARLLGELGYPSAQENVVRRIRRLAADRSNRIFVAELGTDVVGVASAYVRPLIHKDEGFARIACLVVDSRWRDRGVGRELVGAVESWARAEGCGVCEVTSGEQRPSAHRFYESLGYLEKRKRFVKNL
jgi:GNAT superfamily N-acetyltransferase